MTESLHTNSVSLWLMLKRLFDESSYLPLLLVLLTTSSVFVNNGARFHNPFTPVSPFKKDRTMGLKVPTYVYLGENLVPSMTYIYISFDMVIDSDRIPWQLKTKSPAETVLMSLCNCYQSLNSYLRENCFWDSSQDVLLLWNNLFIRYEYVLLSWAKNKL